MNAQQKIDLLALLSIYCDDVGFKNDMDLVNQIANIHTSIYVSLANKDNMMAREIYFAEEKRKNELVEVV